MRNKINLKSGISLIILVTALNTSAQYVTPQQNGSLYSFQVADMYFEVDSGFGSRISSLKLGDEEIMFVDRDYADGILWGSTSWPAPQSDWGWPPSVVLDSDPYSGGITGDSVILVSGVDEGSNLRFKKVFYASEEDTSVTIVYTYINEGAGTENNGAWEITRVPPGGISFFPSGEGSVTGALAVYAEKVNNVTWYEYESSDIGNRKFSSDGSNGWYAHANDNSTLFIKKFHDVHYDSVPTGHKEIELWLNGDHAYIELENLGKYVTIAPGDSISYEVKWYVRQIPDNIDISAGSNELVNYVSCIIGEGPFTDIGTAGYKNLNGAVYVTTNSSTGHAAFINLPAGTFVAKIVDLTGKTIRTGKVTSVNNNIYTGDLQQGIYIYFLSGESVFDSGRLFIE